MLENMTEMTDHREHPALYNSRILRVYLDYLRINHPQVDIDDIFDSAGITATEVADDAHWFTQQQCDLFYTAVVEKTGDDAIARKAGRHSVSAQSLGVIKQYVAGLITTEMALLSLKKIAPFFTRHAAYDVQKVGAKKMVFISTPLAGIHEKPYQCENRLGTIESMPMLFNQHYARVEHKICLHKGAKACHYLISWQNPPAHKFRVLRFFTFLGSLAVAIGGVFILPLNALPLLVVALLTANLAVGTIYTTVKTKELENIIGHNRHWASDQIETATVRYNNSLLAQEIGQASAAIFNIKELMPKLASLMHHRLEFDRGLILLADKQRQQLLYSAGYGYSDEDRRRLMQTSFRLDNEQSKGFFVRAFLDQKPITVTNAQSMMNVLSDKSRELVKAFGIRSLLCVPIVYKKTTLGILAVDNVRSNAPLKKSDVNLLEGIAAQIAISISNAVSFQKLQESEFKYRQTLESIAEGYYEIGLDKTIKFANQALCDLFDCTWDELTAKNFDDFFPPQSIAQLDQLFAVVRTTREPVHFSQFEIKRAQGVIIPVDLSASVIVDRQGQAAGYRGILRNATERLKLEKEKKQLENQLLQAQKMETIGTLAGGIAHNFNNWLAGIQGNISLIRLDAKGHPNITQKAGRVETIIEKAAKMTQQLLGYARTGSYESRLVDLNHLIEEASATFSETRKEVSIHLKLAPDLYAVKADVSQIEQVFWNLFINAIDAMPNGGQLHITSFNTSADALKGRPFTVIPGKYTAMVFRDNGIGIDPEDMVQIFEPFFTTKIGKGTGLGLASAFGIVKAHKGYIDVVSQKGAGATFTVFLPAVDQPTAPKSKKQSSLEAFMGHGCILVVDDEISVLETNAQLLDHLGYEVLAASSGEKALALFEKHIDSIDLVMLDMVMPSMSGKELFARIKALRPGIKTLLCSGYSLNQTARDIMSQGCNGFIQKPFDHCQLSATIKSILEPETKKQ